jgi:translation initiation factor IF-2
VSVGPASTGTGPTGPTCSSTPSRTCPSTPTSGRAAATWPPTSSPRARPAAADPQRLTVRAPARRTRQPGGVGARAACPQATLLAQGTARLRHALALGIEQGQLDAGLERGRRRRPPGRAALLPRLLANERITDGFVTTVVERLVAHDHPQAPGPRPAAGAGGPRTSGWRRWTSPPRSPSPGRRSSTPAAATPRCSRPAPARWRPSSRPPRRRSSTPSGPPNRPDPPGYRPVAEMCW